MRDRERRLAYSRDYYERYGRSVRGQHPLHDAAPVIRHIEVCKAAGMSNLDIAESAGVSASTVSRVLNQPNVRLRHSAAIRLLAVIPRARVTPIGVTRRIRALTALGYSTRQIAVAAGVNVSTVKDYRAGVAPGVVRARVMRIVAAYDSLSMTPAPARDRHSKASVTRARTVAAAQGWAPPLAWNEGTIDDPRAQPEGAGRAAGPVVETIRDLADMGLTRDAIANRLGVKPSAIERALERANHKENAA